MNIIPWLQNNIEHRIVLVYYYFFSANGKKRTDQAVVVNNDSIESEEDMSGSPETSDNESASESKNTLG